VIAEFRKERLAARLKRRPVILAKKQDAYLRFLTFYLASTAFPRIGGLLPLPRAESE